MNILVTGSCGFIGMHVCIKLLRLGFRVIGLDNINNYYDKNLKIDRLNQIKLTKENFKFYEIDLIVKIKINKIFAKHKFNYVVNLAAQAGVRYSIEKPEKYIESNIIGFFNILEACRYNEISHLLYASSSSVYGLNSVFPLEENNNTNNPISLYGATKKANEVMSYTYSHLYEIPSTALRFFTVYGPWGRPDMAPIIFAKAIMSNRPINLYNNGNMIRDFTYIDDVVYAVVKLIKKAPIKKISSNSIKTGFSPAYPAHKILNIGRGKPVNIKYFIELLEKNFKKKAIIKMVENQLGDVQKTEAKISEMEKWINFKPTISIEEGVELFVDWYKAYYKFLKD